MTLEDRVAVITGAAGALGEVVSRRFAGEGARLVLLGRNTEPLNDLVSELNLTEDRYLVDGVDLTDPEATKAAGDRAAEKFDRVDILVHLVGGYSGGEKLVDVPTKELSSMLDQHVWTTFNVVQAFGPSIEASGSGRVVMVSNPYALSPRGKDAPYAAAKAAQEVMAQSLAQEFEGAGATANVILVRSIDADLERTASSKRTKTTPEEITAAILYLCSDKAAMVNGARIPLYGGS